MPSQKQTFFVVILMPFIACSLWISTAIAAVSPAPTPTVFVEHLTSTALFDRLTYPAKVKPKVEAFVLAEVDGVLDKVHGALGQKVRKGQALVTLRHTDPVFQYAPVVVKAPVNGVVSQIEFTEGSRVTAGQKLLVVIDPNSPKVVIELAAADLEDIKIGMTGELRPVGQDHIHEVRVVGISPFPDSATGTATCELEVVTGNENAGNDKTRPRLPPGLMGKVSFKVRERKGIQVPESAIVFRGKETLVRTVDEGIVHLSTVKLGNLRRGYYEVTEGIVEGVNVVVRSSQYVADGQKVQVQTEETVKFE